MRMTVCHRSACGRRLSLRPIGPTPALSLSWVMTSASAAAVCDLMRYTSVIFLMPLPLPCIHVLLFSNQSSRFVGNSLRRAWNRVSFFPRVWKCCVQRSCWIESGMQCYAVRALNVSADRLRLLQKLPLTEYCRKNDFFSGRHTGTIFNRGQGQKSSFIV